MFVVLVVVNDEAFVYFKNGNVLILIQTNTQSYKAAVYVAVVMGS